MPTAERDLNQHDPDEFRRRVAEAVAADAWVSCGNYSKVRPLVLARATHLVWLDYPKPIVMGRVLRRSFVRAITKRELWPGTGNTEPFSRWLDPDHPIRWAWDTYARRKRDYAAMFGDPALAQEERVIEKSLREVEIVRCENHDGAARAQRLQAIDESARRCVVQTGEGLIE